MSGTVTVTPLTSAEIVAVRRYAGYPPNPSPSITAASLQAVIASEWNNSPTGLSVSQVSAILNTFVNAGQNLYGDPCSMALLNLSSDQLTVLRNIYLTNLPTLETAIFTAGGAKLTVKQADVFTRNPNEIAERRALYGDIRLEMCMFLGIPAGPFLNILIPGVFVA